MAKIIQCKNCGKMYSSSLKVCPECQNKTPVSIGKIVGLCIAGVVVLSIVIGAVTGGGNETETSPSSENGSEISNSSIVTNNNETVDSSISEKTESKETVPIGKKNALKKAKDYLDFGAFSYQGLIEQLKYEKFSDEECSYAADNCNANWNEQASKKAKEYLKTNSFSKDELIEQLEYEKFTHDQAVYGVEQNGY